MNNEKRPYGSYKTVITEVLKTELLIKLLYKTKFKIDFLTNDEVFKYTYFTFKIIINHLTGNEELMLNKHLSGLPGIEVIPFVPS